MKMVDLKYAYPVALLAVCLLISLDNQATAQNAPCTAIRKINIGVSVSPPNVVHTSPYVAKELGYFAKRCIDANIVQFEGGQSATSAAAAAQGSAIVSVSDVAIGRGLKVKQIWALAPRMPKKRDAPGGQTAADLKASACPTGGRSAASTGEWARKACAQQALEDAQFISAATAGAPGDRRPDRRRRAAPKTCSGQSKNRRESSRTTRRPHARSTCSTPMALRPNGSGDRALLRTVSDDRSQPHDL